jgi:hypothetical protein
MKKASYDTLLIVASNLTVAEMAATPSQQKPTPMTDPRYDKQKFHDFVWDKFNTHLSRLEKQLETQE